MGQEKSWRQRLRLYLAATLKDDRPLILGQLIDLFADQIPLHRASRKWLSGHRDKTEYATAYKMRVYTLYQELYWLQCRFYPKGSKNYQTIVIPHGAVCPRCGELFVFERTRPVHGMACAARRVAAMPRDGEQAAL